MDKGFIEELGYPDRPQRLDVFLQKFIQPWRVKPSIESRGVLIHAKDGREVRPNVLSYPLDQREDVWLDSPLPPSGEKELQRIANEEWRDLVFVPRTSEFEEAIIRTLTARPRTVRVTSATTLRTFVDSLRNVSFPIRNMYIGAHASAFATLAMDLQPSSTSPDISFEDLLVAIKEDSISIGNAPAALLNPRPVVAGKQAQAAVHIKGCRLGTQKLFLQKLKQALGGDVMVSAPKMFQIAGQMKSPPGFTEYLRHSFAVIAPKQFSSRWQLIKAFQAEGFKFFDGRAVPAEMWEKWVPQKNIHVDEMAMPGEKLDLPVPSSTSVTEEVKVTYNYDELFLTLRNQVMPKPPKGANVRAYVRDTLPKIDERYADSYMLPMSQRWGLATFDKLVDSFTWDIKDPERGEQTIGSCHRYRVEPPVAAGKTLLMNFFPQQGGEPVIGLFETDKRLYTMV